MTASRTPLGASYRALKPAPVTVAEALELAAERGLERLLVPSVFELTSDLAGKDLEVVTQAPRTHGVEVTLGIPYLHPFRVGQDPDLLRVGAGNAFDGLVRTLEVVRSAGTTHAPFMLGYVEDRLNTLVPWAEQLEASRRLLTRLRPVLRDLDLSLSIKTHEEITTFEILRLIEAVGDDVLSVGLDPVNLPLRLEDPDLAVHRLAAHVAHVYLDDATFSADDRTFPRWLCRLGEGVLDWPSMLRALEGSRHEVRFWLDLHKGQYGIDPFDPKWLAHQPDLTTAEFGAVLRLVTAASRRHGPQDVAELSQAQTRPSERLDSAQRTARTWLSAQA